MALSLLKPLLALTAALTALPITEALAVDWFKAARENHITFAITSRTYGRTTIGNKDSRYIMLKADRGGPLVNPRPVNLPESDVLGAAHSSLQQAGFKAASNVEEAAMVIVVAYGMGEYPPPFEFMGIDPVVVPSFRWPELLQDYDQRYHRRDYSDARELGIVVSPAAKPADLYNFIGVRAFDARSLRDHNRWVLLWETRITIDALDRPLADHYRSMLTAASELLGSNKRQGSIRSAPVQNGVVNLGEMEVIE